MQLEEFYKFVELNADVRLYAERAINGWDDLSERFTNIKKAYELYTPFLLAHEGRGDPYIADWYLVFTPIEKQVWGDIRSRGLPMYPQYPAGRYFLDFADPYKKIAIEADSKQFHDKDRDLERDTVLLELGWIVYRIPGYKTFDDGMDFNEANESDIEQWLLHNSEGIVSAIKQKHYGTGNYPEDLVNQTLSNHCNYSGYIP